MTFHSHRNLPLRKRAKLASRLHRARVAVRQALAPMLGSLSDEPRDSMCPDVVTLFSQHLEGDINPSVCAAMETHLALCGRCRSACEVLKRALAACRQLPTPEVPASIAASIRAAIRTVLDKQELDRVRCASYRWVYGLFDERSRDNAQFPRKVMIGEPCYG